MPDCVFSLGIALINANDQIGQTLSDQFVNLPAVSTGRKFYLSWSHYLKLMRIDNIEERHFYGHPYNGIYAYMFEEEYADIISNMQREIGDADYIKYLDAIPVHETHAGYFSIDKKGKARHKCHENAAAFV